MKSASLVLFACLSIAACNRNKGQTPEEKAAEEKSFEEGQKRGKKALKRLASLEDEVKDLDAPPKMKSSVLVGTRNGYQNFDVLLDDELAEPKEFPKVRIILKQQFAECASKVQAKKVYPTDCITPYVVILKPRTYEPAEVSGKSYTPGKIDADAYVFDMSNGKLIGGGRISAETPDELSTKSSNPENELAEKLGEDAFDSLAEALDVKKQ